MSHSRLLLAAAIAACALVAPQAAGAKTPTARFADQANAACASAGHRIERLPAMKRSNVIETFVAELRIVRAMVRRLRTIEAPKAKARRYREYIGVVQASVDLVDRALAAAASDDTARASDLLDQAVAKDGRGNVLAARLGLRDCAKDYGPGGAGAAA
jgi:hypothetical protein